MYLSKWSPDKFVITDILLSSDLTVSNWKELNSITWTLYFFLRRKALHNDSPILPPTNVLILFFFKMSPINLVVVDFPFVPVIATIFWFVKFEIYKFKSLFTFLDIFFLLNFFLIKKIHG